MWSGPGGWGHYPIQQSAYANIPTEEVDWASLAKQWIAQREVMTSVAVHDNSSQQFLSAAVPPPPPPPPSGSDIDHQLQMGCANQSLSAMGVHNLSRPVCDNIVADSCNSQDSADSGVLSQVPAVQSGWESWGSVGWSVPNWVMPPPPPPDPVNQALANVSEGQFRQAERYLMPYEYGPSVSEFFEKPFNSSAATSDFPVWPGSGEQQHVHVPHMLPRSTSDYRPAPRRNFAGSTANVPSLLDDSLLDATKRRQLPAWIREGLEKMEREKLKQVEREKMLQDSQNVESHQPTEGTSNESISTEPMLAAKSRFDSDNEDVPSEESIDGDSEPAREFKKEKTIVPDVKEDTFSLTEDEKQLQIMIMVRHLLTEVLLDVTGQEIMDIASTVYRTAKTKQARAPAKQLAKSSALASITSLGLEYDSDSDSDEEKQGSEVPTRDVSDSSDEETITQRIAQKKAEFERKMRLLEEHEHEDNSILANPSRKLLPRQDTSTPSSVAKNRATSSESRERKLIAPGYTGTGSSDLSAGADDERTDFQWVRKHACDLGPNYTDRLEPEQLSHSGGEHVSYKRQVEDNSPSSSSESDRARKSDASMHIVNKSEERFKAKVHPDSYKVDHGGSSEKRFKDGERHTNVQRHSLKFDRSFSEITNDKRKEQVSHSRSESRSGRSSRSRERDSKKSKKKQHGSHKHRKNRDTDCDDYSIRDRDRNFSSRSKKRHRSTSSSESSDSRNRTRGHHRSEDRKLRRHSSSRSLEEIGKGSYGKKSRAKRKSRSSSRSSNGD